MNGPLGTLKHPVRRPLADPVFLRQFPGEVHPLISEDQYAALNGLYLAHCPFALLDVVNGRQGRGLLDDRPEHRATGRQLSPYPYPAPIPPSL